jgi:hypothetical protein
MSVLILDYATRIATTSIINVDLLIIFHTNILSNKENSARKYVFVVR